MAFDVRTCYTSLPGEFLHYSIEVSEVFKFDESLKPPYRESYGITF